jgi:anti-sigma factor RsiW
MECRNVRSLADAYLEDELLVETNQALLAHLGQCPACRADLKARQALRATLKRAFEADGRLEPTAEFATSLRNRLRAAAQPAASTLSVRRMIWLAVAATLVIAAALAVEWTRNSPSSSPRSATNEIPEAVLRLSESAAGDHRDCALLHRSPEAPVALEQAAAYDGALRGLEAAVSVNPGSLPAPLKLLAAHACLWRGRRFGHLVFSYKGRIASLLITTPADSATILPVTAPAQCPEAAGLSIACFAAPRHALFVVSDLPASDILTLANALAPGVQNHLHKGA